MSKRRFKFLSIAVAALAAFTSATARAEVQLHGLFSNNMVLQRDVKVPVWGTAEDGEKITVSIGEQTHETTTKDGKWKVVLDPLSVSEEPLTLKVSGSNEIELTNVAVGEVWICSGQSNMQWAVNQSADPEKTIAAAKHPQLRLYTVPRERSDVPRDNVVGSWSECEPAAVGNFSAVAYHFGVALQQQLKVPVGLISTNLGGTAAEEWTSKEVLESSPATRDLAGKGNSSKLYNAMIYPIVRFPIRGAIWYQGESNADRAHQYRTLFPAMIKNWRDDWGQGDFPFLFVQLAPFMKIEDQPNESAWAELREAQLLTMLNVPNTAMAVITDVGHETDIHPPQKAPVGQRLALAARALAYGEDLVYSGPIFKSMTVEGNKAVLQFDHVGSGLSMQGDKLKGFTIAGENKVFYNAEAEIVDDTVVVHSPDVEQPAAVRYGWANYPVVNLSNKDGLLASPFRTDKFATPRVPAE